MQHVSSQLFGEKIPADLFYTDHDCDSVELVKHSEAVTRTYFTDAEKLWIEFFAYVGLSETEISESLNGVRTPMKIRRYIRAQRDDILGLRSTYKNSIQKSPKYPYSIDTRAPYSVTTDEARAKGYLLEYGIDTGLDWGRVGSDEGAASFMPEAKEYLAYLLANLGGWSNLHTRNNILTYYSLFTPETLLYLNDRFTTEDVQKYVDGEPAPSCPYVFSFKDYEDSHFGRSMLIPSNKFYNTDSGLLDIPAMERACGGRVSAKAVTLALAWQGVREKDILDIVPVSLGVSKTSVNKVLSLIRLACTLSVDDVERIEKVESSEMLEALPFTPLSSSGRFFDVQANDLYKPKIVFIGFDNREYTVYPWQVSNIAPTTQSAVNLRKYYVWLQRTYGTQVAARYIALYSPLKSFGGVYVATVKREGWGEELPATAPVCPLPIPFEAVYDEKLGQIRYYEQLNINHSTVFQEQENIDKSEKVPLTLDETSAFLHGHDEQAEQSESELISDLSEMVSTQSNVEEEQAEYAPRPTAIKLTPTSPDTEQESPSGVPSVEVLEEKESETRQNLLEEPVTLSPDAMQEDAVTTPSTRHSGELNESIGEYELLPRVIQQVMFTDGDGTRVLKALPGDKKLAIDFALPGIDEHYDHGEASRRVKAEKQSAKHGAFPPLATPPASSPARKVDGITVGELAVKISSPVSKVIWNILNKNQENLKASSISTVSRVLNAPPVAMVQALADEHGWAESILSLAALVNTQPAIILSVFSKNFNKEAPFTVLLNLFGVTEQEALHTLTSQKAGFDVRNIPVRRIAEALGKTYEAVIVESLNL